MDRGVQHMDGLINELSELCGIFPEYWDIFGKKHVTSVETKKAILMSMKLKIDSAEDIKKEIYERIWKQWKSFIEPVHIKSVNDQPITIPVYIPVKDGEEAKLTIVWSIENETGQKTEYTLTGDSTPITEEQQINGTRYIKIDLLDSSHREIGYYGINLECKHPENIFSGESHALQNKSRLIVTPDTCYIPPDIEEGKTWGFSINLYSIHSARNWGIGDFTDLKKIVGLTAQLNGGFVGINPLHVIPNTKPYGISPYSPISRLFKNFIYLDIENIPDVTESDDARTLLTSENLKKELDDLKKETLVDYDKVASLKETILKIAFELFYEKHYTENTLRGEYFKKYLSEQGPALESFALFMALWEHMKKTSNIYTWQQWPEEYQNPSRDAVQVFIKAHEKEILFYQYIQWLIDRQLKAVSDEAWNLGMKVGLYYDLAIGALGGGSDAWSFQDIIAGDADVGAPPDDFNPNGQNWGFPPLNPEKLKESGYELFIQTMRNNMKYGGALRIDHALGLFRLFWIPRGKTPKEGAYVTNQSEDLLRIIALESVRNKTIVIAEDLGTIGENVREALEKFHMLSYRLFYFERNYPDPSFVPPEKYPELSLCAVTTHDLPTLYGYWACQDLNVKKQLGMYPDDVLLREQVKERERDKALILSTLKSQGILPHDSPSEPKMVPQMTPDLCLAIYKFIALTPCKLLLVSLDDIIGTLDQQNMPGTVDEHPNWVQKSPLSLEEIISDKRFTALSKMLRKTTTPLDLKDKGRSV